MMRLCPAVFYSVALVALAAPDLAVSQPRPKDALTATRPITQPTFVAPEALAVVKPPLRTGTYHLTLNLPAHGQVPAWSHASIVMVARGASGLILRGLNDVSMSGTGTSDASGGVAIVIPGVQAAWRLSGSVTAEGAAGDAVVTEQSASGQGTFTMLWFDPCPRGADANGQCY